MERILTTMVNEIAVLVASFQKLAKEHKEIIAGKFWERAKSVLELVFYGDATFEDRQAAVSEAVHRAFNPAHWAVVIDCVGSEFLVLARGAQDELLQYCDDQSLMIFLGDENKGLVPTTLSRLATAKDFDGQSHQMIHMCLSAMTELTKRQPDFSNAFRIITGTMRNHCLYFDAMPESLEKRFNAILSGAQQKEVPVSASAPTKTTAAPPTPAKPANSNLPQKPGKPASNGGSKPKQAHQPQNGVFAGVLSSALENGSARTQTAPTA